MAAAQNMRSGVRLQNIAGFVSHRVMRVAADVSSMRTEKMLKKSEKIRKKSFDNKRVRQK